jgi:hypothetical protein
MTAEQNVKRGTYSIRKFGDVPIQKLSAMRIEQDLHTLLMKGGQKTKEYPDGRPLSPKTVREVAALVSQCLDKAVKWKIIERNPMQDVERPKTHEKEVQIPRLTTSRNCSIVSLAPDTSASWYSPPLPDAAAASTWH